MSPEVRKAVRRIADGHDLTEPEMRVAMHAILRGEATDVQIAALAVALHMKRETADELYAAASVMREHSVKLTLPPGTVIDTCGTGGDGLGVFNVSTATAIVVAACGVTVAKHGNRSISSKCGSADVLEALGVAIDTPIDRLAEHISRLNICFMFAPNHHPALRHAALPRKELGIRTFFNLVGPLSNPANATCHLLGVHDVGRLEQMAQVLHRLGCHRAWVVHGQDGLDEISMSGPTFVIEVIDGKLRRFEIAPHDFGMTPIAVEALRGGDALRNAEIIREILRGEKSAHRAAVLVNAAGALCVAGTCQTPKEGVARASNAIDSGAAERCLKDWIRMTQQTA